MLIQQESLWVDVGEDVIDMDALSVDVGLEEDLWISDGGLGCWKMNEEQLFIVPLAIESPLEQTPWWRNLGLETREIIISYLNGLLEG